MNNFEAKLILACKKPKTPTTLYRSFRYISLTGGYSYNYIASTCKRLALNGLLIRRKGGVKVFYTSTKDAIMQAVSFLNTLIDEQQEMMAGVVVNRKVTEFVK